MRWEWKSKRGVLGETVGRVREEWKAKRGELGETVG